MSKITQDYGIGSAALMAVYLYENASCASGRTTRLLDRAGNDDLIVCLTEQTARSYRQQLRRLGKPSTAVICVPISDDVDHRIRSCLHGRRYRHVHFDHSWIYEFYMDRLRRTEFHLDSLTTALSTSGPEPESPWLDLSIDKVRRSTMS
jgi:hypothetical protein